MVAGVNEDNEDDRMTIMLDDAEIDDRENAADNVNSAKDDA